MWFSKTLRLINVHFVLLNRPVLLYESILPQFCVVNNYVKAKKLRSSRDYNSLQKAFNERKHNLNTSNNVKAYNYLHELYFER